MKYFYLNNKPLISILQFAQALHTPREDPFLNELVVEAFHET